MIVKHFSLTAFLLPFVASQNQSRTYIVDLGYAKYRGIQNDSYPT